MSDLIDRQAAIEAIHNYWISEGRKLPRKMVGEYEVLDGDYKSQLRHNKMLCEAIEALSSAQPDHIGEVTEMVGDVSCNGCKHMGNDFKCNRCVRAAQDNYEPWEGGQE